MHAGLALVLGFAVLSLPLGVEAQQAAKVWRMGVLTGDRPGSVEALIAALRELNYVEGRNLVVERRRFTHEDELRKYATELVALKPDVIVVGHGSAALVMKSITTTVPVVMASSNDALAQGIVTSLARPGGNITGLTNMAPDAVAKRLEILKEAVPGASRIAVLGCRRDPETGARGEWEAMRAAAQARGLAIVPIFAQQPNDLAGTFDAALRQKFDAVLVLECSLYPRPEVLAAVVSKARVPAMYPSPRWAQGGGLMAYGPNGLEQYRRAAAFVDKIFRGAKPGDLPIEQPTKFEFVINLKTARAQGLTIPKSLLVRADSVIE